jgi:hypothetical protein
MINLMRWMISRLMAFWRDPFRVDRDWNHFAKLTADELRAEFHRLLAVNPNGDRFRRLCQYIAVLWVNNVPVCEDQGGDAAIGER